MLLLLLRWCLALSEFGWSKFIVIIIPLLVVGVFALNHDNTRYLLNCVVVHIDRFGAIWLYKVRLVVEMILKWKQYVNSLWPFTYCLLFLKHHLNNPLIRLCELSGNILCLIELLSVDNEASINLFFPPFSFGICCRQFTVSFCYVYYS